MEKKLLVISDIDGVVNGMINCWSAEDMNLYPKFKSILLNPQNAHALQQMLWTFCSFNSQADVFVKSEPVLKSLFQYGMFPDSGAAIHSKSEMIVKMLQDPALKEYRSLPKVFLDDRIENINDVVKNLGILSYWVNPEFGIDDRIWQLLTDYLHWNT